MGAGNEEELRRELFGDSASEDALTLEAVSDRDLFGSDTENVDEAALSDPELFGSFAEGVHESDMLSPEVVLNAPQTRILEVSDDDGIAIGGGRLTIGDEIDLEDLEAELHCDTALARGDHLFTDRILGFGDEEDWLLGSAWDPRFPDLFVDELDWHCSPLHNDELAVTEPLFSELELTESYEYDF